MAMASEGELHPGGPGRNNSSAGGGLDRRAMWLANVLSIVVPLVVGVLLGVRTKLDLGEWTRVLPHLIGGINALTSLLLVVGWVAVRAKKIAVHRAAMTTAFALGAFFLVCYVTYHLSNPSTRFGGDGWIRAVYYTVLISHIVLSLLVLPLVLRAFLMAWIGRFDAHRRLARFAFPVWLYVSVTGVIAYWMISPYYQHSTTSSPAATGLVVTGLVVTGPANVVTGPANVVTGPANKGPANKGLAVTAQGLAGAANE